MAKKTTLIKTTEERDVRDVAGFLRQLADRLEEHEITLRLADEQVSLEVPDRVTLTLKATEKLKKKGTKHRLKITLKWRDRAAAEGFVQVA